jgi:hypothetical protein
VHVGHEATTSSQRDGRDGGVSDNKRGERGHRGDGSRAALLQASQAVVEAVQGLTHAVRSKRRSRSPATAESEAATGTDSAQPRSRRRKSRSRSRSKSHRSSKSGRRHSRSRHRDSHHRDRSASPTDSGSVATPQISARSVAAGYTTAAPYVLVTSAALDPSRAMAASVWSAPQYARVSTVIDALESEVDAATVAEAQLDASDRVRGHFGLSSGMVRSSPTRGVGSTVGSPHRSSISPSRRGVSPKSRWLPDGHAVSPRGGGRSPVHSSPRSSFLDAALGLSDPTETAATGTGSAGLGLGMPGPASDAPVAGYIASSLANRSSPTATRARTLSPRGAHAQEDRARGTSPHPSGSTMAPRSLLSPSGPPDAARGRSRSPRHYAHLATIQVQAESPRGSTSLGVTQAARPSRASLSDSVAPRPGNSGAGSPRRFVRGVSVVGSPSTVASRGGSGWIHWQDDVVSDGDDSEGQASGGHGDDGGYFAVTHRAPLVPGVPSHAVPVASGLAFVGYSGAAASRAATVGGSSAASASPLSPRLGKALPSPRSRHWYL